MFLAQTESIGPSDNILRNNGSEIVYEHMVGGLDNFNVFREGWIVCQNQHLALTGRDIRTESRWFSLPQPFISALPRRR